MNRWAGLFVLAALGGALSVEGGAEESQATPAPLLSGPNVCEERSTRTENVTVRYEKEYKYRTTEHCWDIAKGFRCDVIKTGTKTAYRTQPVRKDQVRQVCCEGFVEEDSADSAESGESGTRRCVTDPGPPAAPAEADALKENSSASSAGFGTGGIIAVVLVAGALVLLVGAVLYYRRKYMGEKDPAYPTVSYASDGSGGEAKGWENNEFDNPMFGDAAGFRESSVVYAVAPSAQDLKAAAKTAGSFPSEPVYAEAGQSSGAGYAGVGESARGSSVHYEAPSLSYSTAPTYAPAAYAPPAYQTDETASTGPYDAMPPEEKLAK